MSFGDVIRSAGTPLADPRGVGGDANTIWSCDTTNLYELNTSDFSVDRSGHPQGAFANGIGGTDTVIWHCDNQTDDVYELSPSDFSAVQTRNAPDTVPSGIGGDDNIVWHTDGANKKIYELSPTDLSIVRTDNTPGNRSPSGMGGAANVIWFCEYTTNDVYELSKTDFSVLQSANSPGTSTNGIGGSPSKLWHCDRNTDMVYELDGAKVFTLSGTISDEFGNPIRDADVSISNGATYTTTTDENGEYSYTVGVDTYDIAISKPRSTFHNITESSVVVSADTTKNITMLTNKLLSRVNAGGMSIPGGLSMGGSRK